MKTVNSILSIDSLIADAYTSIVCTFIKGHVSLYLYLAFLYLMSQICDVYCFRITCSLIILDVATNMQ